MDKTSRLLLLLLVLFLFSDVQGNETKKTTLPKDDVTGNVITVIVALLLAFLAFMIAYFLFKKNIKAYKSQKIEVGTWIKAHPFTK